MGDKEREGEGEGEREIETSSLFQTYGFILGALQKLPEKSSILCHQNKPVPYVQQLL